MKLLFIFLLILAAATTDGQNIPRPNISAPKGLLVNSFTGSLFYQRDDFSLRGSGYRVYASFYYNSASDTADYGYGYGWTFQYNAFCRQHGDTVIIQQMDSKKDTFYLRSGAYIAPVGVYDTLTVTGTAFILATKDGHRQYFDNSTYKKLTRMEDANGNAIDIEYADSVPVKVRNSTGHCLLLAWKNHHLSEIKDSANQAKKFTYTYDDQNNLIKIANPLGGSIRYEYLQHHLARLTDENGSPVLITYGNGGKVKTINSCNTEQQFTFSDSLRRTYVTQAGQAGASTISYFFDQKNRISSIADPDGNKLNFTYDGNNNLLSWQDYKGATTSYQYDTKGNILQETDAAGNKTIYTYENTYNKRASLRDKNGNTTTYGYDTKGNLTTITHPGNITQILTYDANGRLKSTTDANGSITGFIYNGEGDLIQTNYPIGQVTYLYNGSCCSASKITDASGNALDFEYDLLGKLTKITNRKGNSSKFEYDAAGNLTKATDPNNLVTTYGFDGLNRLISVTLPTGSWQYSYDGQSNLIQVTDPNGHAITYSYNKRNQQIKETDAAGNATAFEHDLNGNLTSRTDPNGNKITYKSDAFNRLIEKSSSDNADKFNYDPSGNLTAAYNNNIAYTFDYDNLNRLIKKNIISWGKSISYSYDNAGNRKTMAAPDGGIFKYDYDIANRLTALTNPSNLTARISYDDGGRIQRKTNANGTYTTYHYDDAGRLDSLINWKNSSEKISWFYYQFDNYGNRVQTIDRTGASNFTYDSSYRLKKAQYGDGTFETFTMDGSGNRLQRITNSLTTTYAYNAADQLQSDGLSSYVFDVNGNTVQQTDSALKKFKYDAENRLIEVLVDDQPVLQSQYDPFGEKVFTRNKTGAVSHLLYDGRNLLAELNASNQVVRQYTVGLDMDDWYGFTSMGADYFYQKDGLNSITEITGGNADILNQYRYDAYGSISEQTGSIPNAVLYTGRIYEPAIALYDYRSRYYNSLIGRFITKDRYAGSIETPLSGNKYNYTNGNPINMVDPAGTDGFWSKVGKAWDKLGDISTVVGWAQFARSTKCAYDYMNNAPDMSKVGDDPDATMRYIEYESQNLRNTVSLTGQALDNKYNPIPFGPGIPTEDPCKPKDPPKPNDPTKGPQQPPYKIPTEPVTPNDPNEIVGPAGYDTTKRWVSIHASLPFKVMFENDPASATAAAQRVTIYAPIPQKFNPNSLRITDFGFGSFNFTVPDNTVAYTKRLDLRDSLGLFVDLTAGLDIGNRRAFWTFQSIDPATGLASTLPPAGGFLPVNDSTKGNGDGYVTFTLQPAANAQTRDTALAQALIYFDDNQAVPTNIWHHTIDAVAPTSRIGLATLSKDTITLSLTGNDDAGGSGLREYAIYASDNGSPFTLYKRQLTGTQESYVGLPGHTYCFYSVATDNTGNNEPFKSGCEISIQVEPSVNLPITWLFFRGQETTDGVLLNWATGSEHNSSHFVVERSIDGANFTPIGTVKAVGNSSLPTTYDFFDPNALAQNVKILYYRIHQLDLDGNGIYSNIVGISLQAANNLPSIKVFPNPFDKSLTVQITTPKPRESGDHLKIFTMDGRLIYSRSLAGQSNALTLQLQDLPPMPAGIYIMTVFMDGNTTSVKLIKQ